VSPKRIALVVGTRPDAIKMAPVIRECRRYPDRLEPLVVATAQHRELLGQVLDLFDIVPDLDLDVMRPDQSLAALTARLMMSLDAAWRRLSPDLVVVQGDTTTSFVAALAAYYERVPVAHVEAGLRSGDPLAPFPEEINRRLIDGFAELCFAPTERARQHLLREGVAPERILVTGNTGIDALFFVRAEIERHGFSARQVEPARLARPPIVLVTAHRRETFGDGLEAICAALLTIAKSRPDATLLFPVHPNPHVHGTVHARLAAQPNIYLTPPLEYREFVNVMTRADVILTDSGGIQEEVPSLGTPVLVMRTVTERPEAIEAGVAQLVGTDHDTIVSRTLEILAHAPGARPAANPFGDGHASERIVRGILDRLSR